MEEEGGFSSAATAEISSNFDPPQSAAEVVVDVAARRRAMLREAVALHAAGVAVLLRPIICGVDVDSNFDFRSVQSG